MKKKNKDISGHSVRQDMHQRQQGPSEGSRQPSAANRCHTPWLMAACAAGLYALFFALIFSTCRYTLSFQENLCTFYNDPAVTGTIMHSPGGIAKVAGLWFIQFFTSPVAATAITALLLTGIALLALGILRALHAPRFIQPLSVIPSIILAIMCCNVGFIYGNIVTALLSLFVVWIIAVAVERGCDKDATSAPKAKRGKWIVAAAFAAACVCFRLLSGGTLHSRLAPDQPFGFNQAQERLCRMYVLADREDWDDIAQLTNSTRMLPLPEQNMRNLALARQGRLADMLFQRPCAPGSEALYPHEATPEAFMLLSDIHYNCGEIALARRYAFEANEAYGNYSPRLLKRLVDTNILLGDYPVAEKYINLLGKTSEYKDWASKRRNIISGKENINSVAELSEKVKDTEGMNKFAGMPNNIPDLREILRNNPENYTAAQYLGCRYLLDKNIPAFAGFIEEAYGSGVFTDKMPIHFQEGIAVASIATGEALDQKYRVSPSVTERCATFWQGRKAEPGTLWEYLRN